MAGFFIRNGLVPGITATGNVTRPTPPQATPVNAAAIQNILIDTSGIGDHKVLTYDEDSNTLVFRTVSGGGGDFDQDLNTTDDVEFRDIEGRDATFDEVAFPNGGLITGDAETGSIAHSIDIYTPGLVFCGGVQSCGGGGDTFLAGVTNISFVEDESTLSMNGGSINMAGGVLIGAEQVLANVFGKPGEGSVTFSSSIDMGPLQISFDGDEAAVALSGEGLDMANLDVHNVATLYTSNIASSSESLLRVGSPVDFMGVDVRMNANSGEEEDAVGGTLNMDGGPIINAGYIAVLEYIGTSTLNADLVNAGTIQSITEDPINIGAAQFTSTASFNDIHLDGLLLATGALGTGLTTAPADEAVSNNQMFIWWDQSNTALKFKGKDSGGGVHAGALPSGGASGSFTSDDGKTITVTSGIITGIVGP